MLVMIGDRQYDIELERTLRYYQALGGAAPSDPLLANHVRFMERHVSSRALAFLAGLGIVNHAGLHIDDCTRIGDRLDYCAAYPVLGRATDGDGQSIVISPAGRVHTRMAGRGGVSLAFDICDDDASQLSFFGDMGRDVLQLQWMQPLVPWVLDGECPLVSVQQERRRRNARLAEGLRRELTAALAGDIELLNSRSRDLAIRECVAAFTRHGVGRLLTERYLRRGMDGFTELDAQASDYFRDMRVLDASGLRAACAGPDPDGYTLLLGRVDVALHVKGGALPSPDLMDSLSAYDAYAFDDRRAFCLIAHSGYWRDMYRIAGRR